MHPLWGETHHILGGSYIGKSLHNVRIHKGDIDIGKTQKKKQPTKQHPLHHHPLSPKCTTKRYTDDRDLFGICSGGMEKKYLMTPEHKPDLRKIWGKN